MQPGRARWQRWIYQWILISLWSGLIPIVIAATYFGVKKSPDFDSPLNSLRNKFSPTEKVRWAMRIGSRSHYNANIGTRAAWFGINVEDGDLQRAERVGNGELLGTYQATYIAGVDNSILPTVIIIYRDVAAAGKVSYTTEARGRKPILVYVVYILLGSVVAVVFLNTAIAFSRRKTLPT